VVSAQSAPQLFDLRCLVREKILAFVQEQNPEIFPKTRYLNLQLPNSRSDYEAKRKDNLRYDGQRQAS
jgi:hypothetical protein